ncbi:hypothetical protein D3C71_2111580 [compost metagenome]
MDQPAQAHQFPGLPGNFRGNGGVYPLGCVQIGGNGPGRQEKPLLLLLGDDLIRKLLLAVTFVYAA